MCPSLSRMLCSSAFNRVENSSISESTLKLLRNHRVWMTRICGVRWLGWNLFLACTERAVFRTRRHHEQSGDGVREALSLKHPQNGFDRQLRSDTLPGRSTCSCFDDVPKLCRCTRWTGHTAMNPFSAANQGYPTSHSSRYCVERSVCQHHLELWTLLHRYRQCGCAR